MNTRSSLLNSAARSARQRGSATVIFITLVSIMLILVAANGRTLVLLKKDVQYIEQRQVQRLQRAQSSAPVATAAEAKPSATP